MRRPRDTLHSCWAHSRDPKINHHGLFEHLNSASNLQFKEHGTLTRFRFLALRKTGIGICTQSTWEVRFSNTRKVPYFFNTETQQSVWDPPEELTPEKIEKLPGAGLLKAKEVRASHILVKHSGSRRPSSWKEVNPTIFSSSLHPHNLPRLIDTIF
jgi:hypothetical protein